MKTYGTVTSVEVIPLGSVLVSASLAGSTVLFVDFVADFDSAGGTLLLNGQALAYTSTSEDADFITLAAPLTSDGLAGDAVGIQQAGQPAVDWVANVALVDADDSPGDTVVATIPTALMAYFPEGTYDQPVQVELEVDEDGTYTVLGQPSATARINGALLDPSTMPAAADGLPPGQVATLAPMGGLGVIFLKWSVVVVNSHGDTQRDPVKYRVYGSTSPTMTLDATTLLGETAGTLLTVKALANGTPFSYDTTYYFQVQAYDQDGNGAASPVASGMMNRAASGDLAANSVTADQLAAVLILGSTISTRSLNANNVLDGPGLDLTPTNLASYDQAGTLRVLLDSTGLFTYDQNNQPRVELPNAYGSGSTWRGDAQMQAVSIDTLTVVLNTVLAQGSSVAMQSGVAPPTNPPTWTIDYTTLQLGTAGSSETPNWHGLVGGNGQAWSTLVASSDGTSLLGRSFFATDVAGSSFKAGQSTASGPLLNWGAGSVVEPSNIVFDGVSTYYALHRLTQGTSQWWVVTSHPMTSGGYPNAYAKLWTLAPTAAQLETGSGTRFPALGWDYANSKLLIGQSRTTNSDFVRVWTLTLAATGGTSTFTNQSDMADPYPYNLSTLMYGQFDFGTGTNSYVYGNYGSSSLMVANLGNNDTTKQWDHGSSSSRVAAAYQGGSFWLLDSKGVLTKYEGGNKWTTATDSTWYAAYSWHSAAPAETTLSPVATFPMKKRARLTVRTPAVVPGTADAKVYLAKGPTKPDPNATTTSMTLQGITTGGTQSPSLLITTGVFTPKNNLTKGTFGSATAAQIVSTESSSDPLIRLQGNGAGRIGPWSWDTAGNVLTQPTPPPTTSDTGWVNFTAGVGTGLFATGTATQGVSVCRYRVLNGWCTVQISRTVLVATTYTDADYSNSRLTSSGAIPIAVRPVVTAGGGPVNLYQLGSLGDAPVTCAISASAFVVGGLARAYAVGDLCEVQFVYPIG